MEDEKVLTLKSLEKQAKERFSEVEKKLNDLERQIKIIEKSLRR